MGDESEMIRKMRIGQLQAAAISNAGLAEIDASAYALMLPMMFASYEEWDHVRQKVNPLLEEKLKEKGFVVLAWSDVGWVYFFTKSPMRTPSDLKGMKLAGSHTESRTIDIFKWAGFNPVPISTVDMMTGLQTGLIDSLYLPIILAEGSQYYRQAPHMTDMKWAPLQGAVVMHEKGWAELSADQKTEVLRITRTGGGRAANLESGPGTALTRGNEVARARARSGDGRDGKGMDGDRREGVSARSRKPGAASDLR